MPEVIVLPDEVSLTADSESTLLDLAVEAGVSIAHLCGGRARCSTCRVRIVEGLDDLTERTELEAAMAKKLDFPDYVRLACQTRAKGPVRLWRLVLDETDQLMASQLGKGHYVGPVGREIPDAAILFTDVAGFTAMSESLPAYDVVHILNRFFNRAGDAVEAAGGLVENYMGDGLLAAFGVDGPPKPSMSAVRAGLEILEAAQDIDKYVKRIYGFDFGVRVGVSVGEVIYGLMGAESSARVTVVGDVVNVASRLEAANKQTGTSILVTQDVLDQTARRVRFGRKFDLDLRGKAGHVTAHEVLGLIDEDDEGDRAGEQPGPEDTTD